VLQRKPEPCPHIHARLGESIRERVIVRVIVTVSLSNFSANVQESKRPLWVKSGNQAMR
jgi:hypothetical protein